MSDADDIQAWLASAHVATLSTFLDDARAPGFPYGTVVPYAQSDAGRLIILISDIAVHTKNLKKDPRASLLISDPKGAHDVQASWRVTLVGTMAVGDDDDFTRYRARFPATQLVHGFSAWVLDVKATRYIAGFGRMGWL